MSTHTGDKAYKCHICEKVYAHNASLYKHMRNHTGQRPHVCGICGRTFTQAVMLKNHVRTHTGEKPYICQICQNSFISNTGLNNHKKSHALEKLNKCKSRRAALKSRQSLTKHLKHHTTLEVQDMDVWSNVQSKVVISVPKKSDIFTMKKLLQGSDTERSKDIMSLETRASEELSANKVTCADDSNSFTPRPSCGCGICDEMFETEKEFLEHCNSHGYTPPDAFFVDLC